MAMYALNMLDIALEIAKTDPTFEDVATKFYEHFVLISESLNQTRLWHQENEFFYDAIVNPKGKLFPVRVRSIVGLTVLFGVSVISGETMKSLKDFQRRTEWFKENRKRKNRHLPNEERKEDNAILLSLISKERLEKILRTMLDEKEFLGPGGIRALSKYHQEHPRHYSHAGKNYDICYDPAESTTDMFGVIPIGGALFGCHQLSFDQSVEKISPVLWRYF
jgi:hypothetical protein